MHILFAEVTIFFSMIRMFASVITHVNIIVTKVDTHGEDACDNIEESQYDLQSLSLD